LECPVATGNKSCTRNNIIYIVRKVERLLTQLFQGYWKVSNFSGSLFCLWVLFFCVLVLVVKFFRKSLISPNVWMCECQCIHFSIRYTSIFRYGWYLKILFLVFSGIWECMCYKETFGFCPLSVRNFGAFIIKSCTHMEVFIIF
jgi:hypothetical protein